MYEVSIQYCGGWGYGPHARAVAQIVKERTGVEVKLIHDSGVTGNFEILVNGVLVYSKKKNGDNKNDHDAAAKAIEAALGK